MTEPSTTRSGALTWLPWSNDATNHDDAWAFLDPIDDAVERVWEPARGHRMLDSLFVAATNAGEHGLVWSVWAMIFAARRWLLGDRDGARQMLRRFWIALTAESIAVNGVLKAFTRRGRPADGAERAEGVRMPITSSMPSGHSTSSVMSAVILSEETRSAWERAALYGTAAAVSWSRVHVRIHHPTDVAAGALLGGAIGWAVRRGAPISAPPRRPLPARNRSTTQ